MAEFPEAKAIAFFAYKRTDGFEVSLTLRDETGQEVLNRIEGAITKIKEEGGVPVAKYNSASRGASGGATRDIEYVDGKVCPKDGGRLIKGQSKDGSKKFEKCENGKYNWTTKQTEGCQYILWV